MKVAHLTVVTPGRCGLYETTRDLVAGLRDLGVDSRLVDPTIEKNTLHPGGEGDREALFANIEWAKEANVIVNHSGLGEDFERLEKPIIHVAHGRPRSSFLSERDGSTPIYSYHYAKNRDARFKAIVTFWPEHVQYLEVMFPDKNVFCLTPPVDLERWSNSGPSGYDFHGKKGRINIVCTDPWRDDTDPFVAVNAFALWARKVPGAKLHVYGTQKNIKGWAALFKRIQDDGNMGEICPWVSGLDNVYRAADAMLTSHVIATRSIREAMACGCPVIRIPGVKLNGFMDDFHEAMTQPREQVRARAEELFNHNQTAKEFKRILDSI